MLSKRRFASFIALGFAVVILGSCADDIAPPTAPPAPITPDPSLIGDVLGGVTGVVGGVANGLGLVSCDVEETHTASAVIGKQGGTLRIGPHRLTIPKNALKQPVLISAVAPAGDHVQIKFEPEGLEFKKRVALTMSYADCSLLSPLSLRIVYVNDQYQILEVLPTVTSVLTRTSTAPIDHFSRYMLAD